MSLRLGEGGERFRVKPGILLYPRVMWEGETSTVGQGWFADMAEGEQLEVFMEAVYSHEHGRYAVADLRLRSPDLSTEITGRLLRTVKVQVLLRLAVGMSAQPEDPSITVEQVWDRRREFFDALADGKRVSPDEEILRSIAMTYRLAEVSNEPPAQAVAHHFDLQQRTATNWIRRAREAGYFDG
ncbi:hypothetical protein C5C03_04080 [Clavibacter michiganensis]|nr:hypothetical protein C5C03_04080 [Clavibacter michiganensis]PPF97315.1 hypothetical protein C5C05_05465 [Clavibacter michiganensis]